MLCVLFPCNFCDKSYRVERISLQCRRLGFDPWVGKIPWGREWLPNPVFLSGKSHGQKGLAGYSPWGSQRVRHNWVTNTFTFSSGRGGEIYVIRQCPITAVPKLLGTGDWFSERQFFHWPGWGWKCTQ